MSQESFHGNTNALGVSEAVKYLNASPFELVSEPITGNDHYHALAGINERQTNPEDDILTGQEYRHKR